MAIDLVIITAAAMLLLLLCRAIAKQSTLLATMFVVLTAIVGVLTVAVQGMTEIAAGEFVFHLPIDIASWRTIAVTVAIAAVTLLLVFRTTQLIVVGVSFRPTHAFPKCSACGYNLTGNASGVCPECGASARDAS